MKSELTLPPLPAARRAALWLLFLGPFFYASYGFANYFASMRDGVPNIAMDWESAIPFVGWTIIPYWSINLFYVTTLFFNAGAKDADRVAKRYLTCQIIAVACFIVFPLQAVFVKPETSGLTGFMFKALGSFDRPFNQAPSLHIALLVVIWDHWRKIFDRFLRIFWNIWCLLIAGSVLTTFQHHIMDIPAGGLLGLFALWLFPDKPSTIPKQFIQRKTAIYYAFGAILSTAFAIAGIRLTPLALFWVWPALSLAIMAFAYFNLGVSVFQKAADGTVPFASRWLLMPYRLGAKLNAWAWTRRYPPCVHVAGNVHLGRFPNSSELKQFDSVIDMSGEMIAPKHEGVFWRSFPVLDLTAAPIQTLNEAAQAIQMAQENGRTLVTCALGMQRSAAAVGVWLVKSKRAKDARSAIELLRQTGRPIHLHAAAIEKALSA